METQTVLVTGAFGMVGTETVVRLRERGAAVVAMLAEISGRIGRWRHLLTAFSPIVRVALRRRMPYREMPGVYADPWTLIRRRWPGAAPD